MAGGAYHVIFRTHGRRPLFRDLQLGRIVVTGMRWQDEARRTSTLAFVVMPDHVHWLFTLGPDASLAGVMSRMKGFTARRINASIGRAGSKVWQVGFFDHAVRRDEDLQAIARYIVANPLRAEIATSLGDYALWDACWV
jgi:REP element-mobilizing transposase RayT